VIFEDGTTKTVSRKILLMNLGHKRNYICGKDDNDPDEDELREEILQGLSLSKSY